ncbi:hypothetical protein LSAT2_025127 [Lamellibrachia satsuma]|nr:hypothetical protein LSAT2_025127 [Lamellibrachia satsuma]
MLGTALTAMTQMRHLSVRSCYLRDQTWRHIVDGIWCHQMEQLNCQHNELTSGITERRMRHIRTEMPHLAIRCQHSELTPGNSEETMRRLLTQRRHLVIRATFCDVPDESISCLCAEFGNRFPWSSTLRPETGSVAMGRQRCFTCSIIIEKATVVNTETRD